MSLKMFGALLVVIACGGIGFTKAASYRKEIKSLRELIRALEYMEWELQYRLTSLPDLFKNAAQNCNDILRPVLLSFTNELESQISPNAEKCMDVVLEKCNGIPRVIQELLRLLAPLLGRFDLEGQLKGFASVRNSAINYLNVLETNKADRIRSYHTLGICAGAAIVIMII